MNGSVAERVARRHRGGRANGVETQTARRRGRARRRGALRQPDTLERYLQKPRKPRHQFYLPHSGCAACGRPPDRFLGEMKNFYDGHPIPFRTEPDRIITGEIFGIFWKRHQCHLWQKFKQHGGLDAVPRIHESHSRPVSPADGRGCPIARGFPLHGGPNWIF
jgi:hypothetical protein